VKPSEKLVMTAVGPIPVVPIGEAGAGLFKCKVCGVDCPITPADRSGAYCPKHCPDHDYQYQRGEGHRCVTCHAPAPEDWFDE